MKTTKRAKSSQVHEYTVNGDSLLITRIKPPHMVITYDVKTHEHAVIESDVIPGDEEKFVKKAVAWAKHNFKS